MNNKLKFIKKIILPYSIHQAVLFQNELSN